MLQTRVSPTTLQTPEVLGEASHQTRVSEPTSFAQALRGLEGSAQTDFASNVSQTEDLSHLGPENITDVAQANGPSHETLTEQEVFNKQTLKDLAGYDLANNWIAQLDQEIKATRAAIKTELTVLRQDSPAAGQEIEQTIQTQIANPGQYFKSFYDRVLEEVKGLVHRAKSFASASPREGSDWNSIHRSKAGRTDRAQKRGKWDELKATSGS